MSADALLTFLGFAMVATFMVLIMTKRLSPLVALVLTPIVFALIAGFGGPELGPMIVEGIKKIAPTAVMLMFAILYFGLMIDVGLFDPIVRAILKAVGSDPLKVVVGTAILASFVSLDGDGSTTYMIVVGAMLPLYHRLKLNVLNLTCVTILASGVMNLTPWGGPLARAASALQVDPMAVFLPMIPAMAIGIACVLAIAFWLGLKERARLGSLVFTGAEFQSVDAAQGASNKDANNAVNAHPFEDEEVGPTVSDPPLKRPKLFFVNAGLTLALMISLFFSGLPLSLLFMVAFALALVINFPNVAAQRERIAEHSKNVVAVVSLIFAAGVFTGILSGTGMVDAISKSVLHIVPDGLGPYFAPIIALLSLPFTFFISNDAFYFGVLPVAAQTASAYGITSVEMARASLIGQPFHLLSPLVPSTYLLVGLASVEFGDHQRFTLGPAILVCLVMLVAAMATGAFPFFAG